jgi:hypothetical protein
MYVPIFARKHGLCDRNGHLRILDSFHEKLSNPAYEIDSIYIQSHTHYSHSKDLHNLLQSLMENLLSKYVIGRPAQLHATGLAGDVSHK